MQSMDADFSISQNKQGLSGVRNVLLIQLGDIGDVVLTTPTIRAVKETCPEARVSIVVSKPYGCLLGADPNIYEVIEASKIRGTLFSRLCRNIAFVRQLRLAHYDLVIDLRTGDHGAILSFLSGASVRVGSPGTKKQFWRKFVFTNMLRNIKPAPPPAHPGADQSLRIVRGIGIDTADTLPRLFISPQDQARAEDLLNECGLAPGAQWVTINPFSRWKYKEWNNAKWGEVIDRLWEAHRIPAVLIGSAEESAGCQSIVAGREGRTINLAGKTTLGELAVVISLSSIHLGVDSAAPHIAAALSTPTVTIHGPSDWRAWRIVNEHHRVVSPLMYCVPCNMTGCNGSGRSLCLEVLAAEPVICAALELLAGLQL
jgi:predicted lipopolysaccharide heptosyltransferase III